MESLKEFLSSSSFMPHGHCYLWRKDILWLNVTADTIVALAYFAIPWFLVSFVRKRRDLRFNWIFWMFAAFILLCGSTHVVEIWTIWHPNYGAQGLVKLATGIVSVITAIMLWPLLPKALALPSFADLEESNHQLTALSSDLEQRVTERTQELDRVNQTLRDKIIELERAQAEINQAKDAAEAASRAKSTFLANMSHEIRTPLNAVIGFSRLLGESGLSSEEAATFISTIDRNGKALTQLIDDVLDLSKVEAGHMRLDIIPMTMASLLEDLAGSWVVKAQLKGVELNIEVQSSPQGCVPEVILTDPARLRQILFNIVGNAIKFTEKGHIDVRICAEKIPSESVWTLSFEVSDTGCGIAEEAQDRLFQVFSQADSSTTRRFGGTGLGLALSRRLAQALGGNVELLRSALGVGTVFAITIKTREPVEATAWDTYDQAEELAVAASSGDLLAGITILVAEDLPDNQALIRRLLLRAGAQVDVVDNGMQAIERASSAAYDIILMDIQMPVLDGYDATVELRRRGYDRPIIALTAHALHHERRDILQAGCNDHLTKPINYDRLIKIISRYVLASSG